MEQDKQREVINKLAGISLNINRVISYQEDSVVSKTIITGDTGSVTIFAFSQGQGLSEHTAQFDALVYILDGESEITISGKSIKAKEGEMVIMPANKPHSLKAIRQFKMLLVMIKS